MDIYLDSKTLLMIVRSTAFNKGIALAPCDIRVSTAPTRKPVRLSRLGIPGLFSYLHIPEERPLGIVVPHRDARVRAEHIRCTVDSLPRGKMPYLQLCSTDPAMPSPLVSQESRVFVQSPASIVLGPPPYTVGTALSRFVYTPRGATGG